MACWGFTASEILCQTPYWSTLDSWGFFFMLMTASVGDYRAGFSSEQQEQEQLAESVTVQRTAPSQYMQFNIKSNASSFITANACTGALQSWEYGILLKN